jgi:transposase
VSGFVPSSHRRQQILLPDVLDDYVSEENSVRFIDAFVDELDLSKLGFVHAAPNEMGRPPYNPADLLKLYLYGYLNRVRSSRRLERECQRNLEVIWLMRRLAPDFKTIADFRAAGADPIRLVFREMVELCRKLGLLDPGLVAIDGSKFRAVNSLDRHHTPKSIEVDQKLIDKQLARYLKELDENDAKEAQEPEPLPYRVKNLKEKIAALLEKKRTLEAIRERLEASGLKEISLTDPDSRVMKNHGRLEMCYNTQIAVEAKNKMVVAYDVDNQADDHHQLAPMAIQAKEALGVDHLKAVADKGYYSGSQADRCVNSGITPYVPQPEKAKGSGERAGISPEFYKDKFRYDPTTDRVVCPAGHSMHPGSALIRPRRLQPYRSEPMAMKVYSTNACFSCPHYKGRCTSSPQGRKIFRMEHDSDLEAMSGRMKTEEGRTLLGLRKSIVEHPFGTIKRGLDQGYMLLRGTGKVRGEMGLTLIAYNIRRALNLRGTRGLVAALAS